MEDHKEKILELRSEGKSYKEIVDELGCSKGTVSYHCGKGQKEKTAARRRKQANGIKYKVYKKIDDFIGRTPRSCSPNNYVARGEVNYLMYKKIINNPRCYITGEDIDLNDSGSWSLDHIVPISKGGSNDIDNMGLCLSYVNYMKYDFSLKEFEKHAGYIYECLSNKQINK